MPRARALNSTVSFRTSPFGYTHIYPFQAGQPTNQAKKLFLFTPLKPFGFNCTLPLYELKSKGD